MAGKKHNELAAGIFVVITAAALLGVVLWLGAAGLFKTRGQEVYFFARQDMGSVGLAEGSELYYCDSVIGEIVEVIPQFGKGSLYRARLEQTDLKLHSDALAEVDAPVMRDARLVVKDFGGRRGAKTPDADNPITLKLTGIEALMNAAAAEFDLQREASLLAKIHVIVDGMNDIAARLGKEMDATKDGTLITRMRSAVKNFETITSNLARQTRADDAEALLAKVHAVVDDLKKATASLAVETDAKEKASLLAKVHRGVDDIDELIASAAPKVHKTLDSAVAITAAVEGHAKKDLAELFVKLRGISTDVAKASADFVEVASVARKIVVLNHENIDEVIDNMVLVSANLKATAKEVRRNPWRLLHSPDKKELRTADISAAARAYADGATQLDQAITKLKALRRLPTDDPQLPKAVQAVRKHLESSFNNLKKVEEALWKELTK